MKKQKEKIYGAVLGFNKGRDKKTGKIIRWSIPVTTSVKSKAEAMKEFMKVRRSEERRLKEITKSFAPALVKEFGSVTEARKFYTKKGWRF